MRVGWISVKAERDYHDGSYGSTVTPILINDGEIVGPDSWSRR